MAEEDEEVGGPAGVRTFWTGTITFGLVSVPVSLFPATKPRSVSLRMVSDEGSPIQRRYVCSKDEKPLDADDIVRGYEIEKGKFVVVTDEELEAIEPRKSREIDLRLFVKKSDIDPVYYERAYFLTPAAGSTKAYRLLAEVMERSDRVGIATFVMRSKEYLVAILAENGILRAETLRFQDEIRSPEDVGLPKKMKPKPADIKRFETQITKHTGKIVMKEFLDDYAESLEKIAQEKFRKGKDLVEAPERAAATEDEEGGEVIDLLAALRRSLGAAGKEPRKPARKAASRKKPAARKTSAGKKTAAKKK